MAANDLNYFTKIYFTQLKSGSIELAFKSSQHQLRTAVAIKDLSTLKNIHSQIGDIIKEIEEDEPYALVEIPEELPDRFNEVKEVIKAMDQAYGSALKEYEEIAALAGITDELHRRLHVQARNLLLEYRLSPQKSVPVEKVEGLMRLYGNLIAELIWEKQRGLK